MEFGNIVKTVCLQLHTTDLVAKVRFCEQSRDNFLRCHVFAEDSTVDAGHRFSILRHDSPPRTVSLWLLFILDPQERWELRHRCWSNITDASHVPADLPGPLNRFLKWCTHGQFLHTARQVACQAVWKNCPCVHHFGTLSKHPFAIKRHNLGRNAETWSRHAILWNDFFKGSYGWTNTLLWHRSEIQKIQFQRVGVEMAKHPLFDPPPSMTYAANIWIFSSR